VPPPHAGGERRGVAHRAFGCVASAAAANGSPETIRARRKSVYRKLGLARSNELVAALLAVSLEMLAHGERIEARPAPFDAAPPAASDPVTLG
jgi:hypothetical protein